VLGTIRELLSHDPFQPFRLVLTSGDRYPVRNPSLVVVMQSQIFIAEPKSDQFHLLRISQIAAVESLGKHAA
jgi:hypothetical protein